MSVVKKEIPLKENMCARGTSYLDVLLHIHQQSHMDFCIPE